jgi:hypothetical protein
MQLEGAEPQRRLEEAPMRGGNAGL